MCSTLKLEPVLHRLIPAHTLKPRLRSVVILLLTCGFVPHCSYYLFSQSCNHALSELVSVG
jgi:hypothetical protein